MGDRDMIDEIVSSTNETRCDPQHNAQTIYIYIYIYIERERERWMMILARDPCGRVIE